MNSVLTTLLLAEILLTSKVAIACFPDLNNLVSGSVDVFSSLLGLSLLNLACRQD